MSFPYTPKLEDEKLDSLRMQYEYLKLLRLRHLQWMNSATDVQTEGTHLEIAELLEQMLDRYQPVMEALER